MPNRDFEDLARAQRQTVQALGLLGNELTRSRGAGDETRSLELRAPVLPNTGQDSEVGRVAGQATAATFDRVLRQGVANAATDEGTVQEARPAGVQDALGRTTVAVRSLTQSLGRNTQALDETSKSLLDGIRGSFGGLQSNGRGGLGFLSGGLGLTSLGLRIAGLFRGDREEPTSPTPFELPPGIDIEAGNTGGILVGLPRVARGQDGQIRNSEPQPAPAQIVVNVSAMDSQSFLDRSSDIAQAVRDAMLHMHPLNDIVREV